ncbi:MAG TPA: threonine synthase, partial [Planctomycetaceae bacterium]|nr:threonine synthase [Planctomycetaceae bacterium]
MSTELAFQRCINPACGKTYAVSEVLTACTACGNLLDIEYDWSRLPVPKSLREFEARWANRRNPLDYSGVWRFRSLLP